MTLPEDPYRSLEVQAQKSMPRITTEEFLERVANRDFKIIKLNGVQSGAFCLILETTEAAFILENKDGTMKHYPRVDNALVWLRRMTDLKEVVVNIEIWKTDRKK